MCCFVLLFSIAFRLNMFFIIGLERFVQTSFCGGQRRVQGQHPVRRTQKRNGRIAYWTALHVE